MIKDLLYDLTAIQPNDSGKRHGGGKYGEIVFLRMVESGIRPVCFYRSSLWLNPDIAQVIRKQGLRLIDLDSTSLEEMINQNDIEILYSCLLTQEMLQLQGCKIKGTIHGLRGIETPHDSIFWRYRNISLRRRIYFVLEKWLAMIGCRYRQSNKFYMTVCGNPNVRFAMVSHHSATSLICYYPQFKGREIPVFYSPSTSSKQRIDRKIYEDKYFLMVSGNRWEKNCLRAIEALDRLFSENLLNGYRCKITGVNNAHLYRYKLKNPDHFDFLGYVPEPQLEQLYHDAFCFIYPSLNEGFGYPPLEAMRYGVPVLASPYSSIPEICQGAALYFNPTSVEEIMNRILLVTTQPELYAHLQKLSYDQYALITTRQERDLEGLIKWIVTED